MELYPLSFSLEPGQRSVQTSITGKKVTLQDIRVNLRGVLGPEHGDCKRLDLPSFVLEGAGDRWHLSWDAELSADTRVIIEAQGAGGQLTRSTMLLRAPVETQPPAPPPGAALTSSQRYEMLVAGGLSPDQARSVAGLPALGEGSAQ